MSIGVSHDLDTGNVVLVHAAAKMIYDLTPSQAHQVAAQLRTAARTGTHVLVAATASNGTQVRIGGSAEHAMAMSDDLDRHAELAMAIRMKKSGG